jgi:hypothetical protein
MNYGLAFGKKLWTSAQGVRYQGTNLLRWAWWKRGTIRRQFLRSNQTEMLLLGKHQQSEPTSEANSSGMDLNFFTI